MQDNDHKHSARSVKTWFQQNEVPVMEWSSQSPDLNRIEHLWGVLKNKIGSFKSKNKQELWEKIQETLYSIPPEVCANLVGSYESPLSGCYKNESIFNQVFKKY